MNGLNRVLSARGTCVLLIGALALLPAWGADAQVFAYEDFESSVLPGAWTDWGDDVRSGYSFEDPEGSGDIFLFFGPQVAHNWQQVNSGIETEIYDLSLCNNALLEFEFQDVNDDSATCPTQWEFDESPDGDCLGVSMDGTTYYRVMNLTGYTEYTTLDLNYDLTPWLQAGYDQLSFYYNDYDNYSYPYDGLLINEFTISCGEYLCDDQVDNDGDGDIDCLDADCVTVDDDGDGYLICTDDCDDGDPAIHPGATELCAGFDND